MLTNFFRNAAIVSLHFFLWNIFMWKMDHTLPKRNIPGRHLLKSCWVCDFTLVFLFIIEEKKMWIQAILPPFIHLNCNYHPQTFLYFFSLGFECRKFQTWSFSNKLLFLVSLKLFIWSYLQVSIQGSLKNFKTKESKSKKPMNHQEWQKVRASQHLPSPGMLKLY